MRSGWLAKMSDFPTNSQTLQAQGTYGEPNRLSQITGRILLYKGVRSLAGARGYYVSLRALFLVYVNSFICLHNERSPYEQPDLAGSRYIHGTEQTLTNDRYANLY